MKTINKFLSVVAILGASFALASCNNEDFLATTQYDIVDGDAMFENDDNAIMGMTGVYKMMNPSNQDGDWGFKPNLMTGCHPTMDTQATGWDKDWMAQNWNAGSTELGQGWAHCYHGISRANEFLAGLEANRENLSAEVARSLEGEARAVRAFFYMWLGTSFGRVPMLMTGESYVTDPQKARAETYVEMWDVIIADLEAAAGLLEWKPMNGEYGRATKGMALAYLGDAYMWKAYRLSDGANNQTTDENAAKECYQKAANCFKQILDSKTYELSRSFTTNWDPAGVWNKECIWAEQLEDGDNASGWPAYRLAYVMIKWYTACQANGGWGSEFLSWEWWSCFEPGDKRREGSACTGAVPQIKPGTPEYDPKYEGWYVESVWGKHPYLREDILKPEEAETAHFHNNFGEPAPSIWTMKLWRSASARDEAGAWGHDIAATTPIYWKRLSNVMIDYAECLFRLNGGEDATAWALLDELRNRAFGNLEVGHEKELTDRFLPYYQKMAKKNYNIDPATFTEYPIPFNTATVNVTPAKENYTKVKAAKGFGDCPVWKIAVNEERRKEFCSEWCLRPDMQRSGYLKYQIEYNYPNQSKTAKELTDWPWSNRSYSYSEQRMDMPIPAGELSKNKLCDQNPGY